MAYLAIFFCIVTFIVSYKKYKHFYHPIVFFTGLWSVILFFANLQLFDMYGASNRTYFIILIGCISFVCGCVVAEKIVIIVGPRFLKEYKTNDKNIIKGTYIHWIMQILCIITILVYTVDLIQILPLYISGNTMEDIRAIYAFKSGTGIGGPLFSVLRSYVAAPFALALIPISALEAFTPSRKRYTLVFICAYFQICNTLIEAGRVGIVQWLLMYVIIYLIVVPHESRKKITRKMKRRIIFSIICCASVVVYLTMLRGVDDQIKGIYFYVSGCVPFFDLQIDMVDKAGFYSYGLASMFGIMVIFQWILSVFGIYVPFLTKVSEVATRQEYYLIGKNTNFNAFVTTFYHFYVDGRVAGVMIGMLFFGYICGKLYKNIYKKEGARDICVFALLIMGLMMSMVRFWMVTTTNVLAVMYVMLLYPKKCNSGEKNEKKFNN